jgi:HAD superfamily hydrolase (TIGR01509 family)
MAAKIEALTFDWYGTLANHRHNMGRGRQFSEYLASHGLQSAPWDRRVLYSVFDYYGRAYKLESSAEEKRTFWIQFTRLLFEHLQVCGATASKTEVHAAAIRDIFGSACLELYADVQPVLHALKQRGLRLAVVSNWHRGLDSFCHEMHLSNLFDTVISSSDIGIEEPDPRLFNEAVYRLRLKAGQIVHVGDSPDDDFRGAVAAGLRAILIDRGNVHCRHANRIGSLYELEGELQCIV